MNLNELQRPLSGEEIEFRVQSINNGGFATILVYKDARVDMNRLDEVVGALNWKREHVNNNKNCIVSIFNPETKEWVSKEDTGTESMTEKEKGLASDSFKRACFNWGIGRELYDYPRISVQLKKHELQETGQAKPKYRTSFDFKLHLWKWDIQFNEDNSIKSIKAIDDKGLERYSYGVKTKPQTKQPAKPQTKEKQKVKDWLGLCNAIADPKQENITKEWALKTYELSEARIKQIEQL